MTEDVRRRIAALRRKASSGGASEAEAMAAAAKAAELMKENQLSDQDIDFDQDDAPIRTKGKSPRDRLWAIVAACTNTAIIYRHFWADTRLTFVGRAPGPEIGVYLTIVLNRAFDREIREFKSTALYRRRRSAETRRTAVHDFTVGMVDRLGLKLLDLFQTTRSTEAGAEAKAARDARFPEARGVERKDKAVRFGNAAEAGARAGARTEIAHGVKGQGTLKQLGAPNG